MRDARHTLNANATACRMAAYSTSHSTSNTAPHTSLHASFHTPLTSPRTAARTYDGRVAIIGEILVEPFVPGNPGTHVRAAWQAAETAGATLEVGPFGTVVRAATPDAVFRSLDAALRAAVEHGATRVSTQVVQDEPK